MRELETFNVMSNAGNPTAVITRPDNATTYTALDVVGGASTSILTFDNVIMQKGEHFIIMGIWMKLSVASIPSGMDAFRLHLYNAPPTNIADNAAYNLPAADLAKYLGWIDLSKPTDLGDNLFTQNNNINFKRKLASTSDTIYGLLQTMGAYTPTNLAVKTIGLESVGV